MRAVALPRVHALVLPRRQGKENVFAFQVGKSERISSTLMSTARYSSASATEMRMPRTHGFAPSLPGSMGNAGTPAGHDLN
jgi:hypothetical protein